MKSSELRGVFNDHHCSCCLAGVGAAPDIPPLPLAPSSWKLPATARPGQESADLGGLLYAFRRVGVSMALLRLTRGEASPLNSTSAPLQAVRPWELQRPQPACWGICSVTVASFPDGGRAVIRYPISPSGCGGATRWHLLLAADHRPGGRRPGMRSSRARWLRPPGPQPRGRACRWRRTPGRPPRRVGDLGADAPVARAIQKAAAFVDASQAEALPQLVRRIDQLDGREPLRWLVSPRWTPADDDALAAAGLR